MEQDHHFRQCLHSIEEVTSSIGVTNLGVEVVATSIAVLAVGVDSRLRPTDVARQGQENLHIFQGA